MIYHGGLRPLGSRVTVLSNVPIKCDPLALRIESREE